MAINKKLIHFKEKADFVNEVANDNILDHSIVFIQDSKEISTHGTVYKTVNWSTIEKKLDYMRIVALEDGLTVYFTNSSEYSLDRKTWQSLPAGTKAPAINKGQYIAFRSNKLTPNSSSGIGTFSIDKQCNLSGNCMSLLFGDEFSDKVDLTGYNCAFKKLFYSQRTIKSVDPGFLPATTLSNNCYQSMFQNCSSLTTAPELPATTLANYCYQSMFDGCSSLTTAPELPATTLNDYCYQSMFYNCSSLTTSPELPATTLTYYCYQNMFYGCSSLATAPELPATTLGSDCYQYMFKGCSSLTAAPELPATTLTRNCYNGMFDGCTSLTTAPELPATTLASGCYTLMFYGCKSLTTAPELPATELVRDCYKQMFDGCKSLNYIKALFTTTPSFDYTGHWVNGVSPTGTFVKSNDATWDVTGANGIPTNWAVLKANPDYMKVVATGSSGVTVYFTNPLEYSLDGTTWQSLPANTKTPAINEGQYVAFRANLTPTKSSGIGTFHIDGWCDLKGNCMSLLFGDDCNNKNDLTGYDYAFYKLFYSQQAIRSVDPGFLPATTLANYCYSHMFDNCQNLKTAPDLPATTLASHCYWQMFIDCVELTTAPELPATTLADSCYEAMFMNCNNITTAPELPATTLADKCYSGMFNSCDSLTTAPELPATTLADNCYNDMFAYCANLNYIKALFTTEPSSSYTNNWVNRVSSTGTFVKSKDATWDVTGYSGVPENWTVEVA